MTTSIGFPNIKEPFIDPRSGQISRTWWLFLQRIFVRVGGSDAPDIGELENQIAAIRQDVNELGAEVAAVDQHVEDVDTLLQGFSGAALVGALLLRIASLEVQVASMAIQAPSRRIDDVSPVASAPNSRRVADIETMVNQ